MYVSWKLKKNIMYVHLSMIKMQIHIFYYCICIEANAVEDHYGCEVLYINTVLSNIFK